MVQCSRVADSQLVKEFPTFYVTRKSVTLHTTAARSHFLYIISDKIKTLMKGRNINGVWILLGQELIFLNPVLSLVPNSDANEQKFRFFFREFQRAVLLLIQQTFRGNTISVSVSTLSNFYR
jgi:hypothetical protein